jgi:hypothetical protein
VDQREFGETGGAEAGGDRLATAREPCAVGGGPEGLVRTVALEASAADAGAAMAATLDQRADHVITDRGVANLGADLSYDARHLVAEHGRQRRAEIRLGKMQVRVAKPAGLDLNQNLPMQRTSDLDVLDVELAGEAVEHCRLHGTSLRAKGCIAGIR